MRLKIATLLLIIAISACTFQVDVIETPQPSETAVPVPATSTPDNSATPPPLSTQTLLPTESSVVSIFPPPEILPIVFPPNGTAQIVVGSVPNGASQTYSLNASMGQVMAVSILPEDPALQGSFDLEIKGRDGSVLCPENNDVCLFWRGVLPSSQEYLIKITSHVGGVFKMRVAINPPGNANQYFDYADPQGRYTLSYSDEFAPMHYMGAQAFKFTPEFALQYIDTKQYVRTNLSEAYFLVGSGTDPQAVSTCTQPDPLGGPEDDLGGVTINGIQLTKSAFTGAAAGNTYGQIFHRALHDGVCYEVTYFIHDTNMGNYEPGAVTEYDREGLLRKLDEILSTLVLQ